MSRTPALRRAHAARPLTLGVALVVMAATAGCGAFGSNDEKTLTATFDRTVGLYEASDVRILGVRIGEVTEVQPEGDSVRVEMTYEGKYDIPEEAKAVVVAPSVVSDRYVQLTPAYTGGPVLASSAVLGLDRTQVPLELDDVFEQLDSLNLALGPNGANADGALSDLLKVSAENLDGNGELFNTTLRDVSQFVETLSGQRDDLFGTITNLQQFTTTIANSDDVVRDFNRDLATVAEQLEGEREDLATAVTSLSVALGEVATFVDENEEGLTTNVRELGEVTRVFTENRTALEELIDTAPGALGNLQLAYNPSSATLDTRDNAEAQAQEMPLVLLCVALQESDNLDQVRAVEELAGSILGPTPAPTPGDTRTALERACEDALQGEGGGEPSSQSQSGGGDSSQQSSALPFSPSGEMSSGPPPASDMSLAGLLVGSR